MFVINVDVESHNGNFSMAYTHTHTHSHIQTFMLTDDYHGNEQFFYGN